MTDNFPFIIQILISILVTSIFLHILPELKLNSWTIALTFVVLFLLLSNYVITKDFLCSSPLKICEKHLPMTTKHYKNKNKNNNKDKHHRENQLNNFKNANRLNQHLNKINNYRKQLDLLNKEELEELNGPQLKRMMDALEMNIKGQLTTLHDLTNAPPKYNNDKNIPTLYVNNDVFPDSVKKFKDLHIPVMGPLDEMNQNEMEKRLQYLYYATQHPYLNISYREYESISDKILKKDKSSLIIGDKSKYNIEIDRWYPSMSINQINYRDCTNHENGPLSCIQSQFNQSIVNDDTSNVKNNFNNSNNSNNSQKEAFRNISSVPKSLENNKNLSTLFKNTGLNYFKDNNSNKKNNQTNINQDGNPRDISNDLCTHCTVGKCWKGICGSNIFEKRNHNLIDEKNLIHSYVMDNIPLV